MPGIISTLLSWARTNAEGLTAVLAFLALAVGFGLVYLPLALIVPGAIVFAALVWKHLRGGSE